MAQYLLSLHVDENARSAPRSEEQTRELVRRIGELEAEMRANDVLVYSGRLAEPEAATVVRVEGGATLTTDGPFAETKEHLGGFYLINASGHDEAVAWGAKTADCIGMPIEVRAFVAARDAAAERG